MSNPYPIERYLSVRSAHSPRFMSDGKTVAFISDVTGIAHLWTAEMPAIGQPPVWPVQRTFSADKISSFLVENRPGGSRFLFGRDKGGNENLQIFLLDENNREKSLTPGQDRAIHIPGEWSDDGRKTIYAANRRDPGLFDLYVREIEGDETLVYRNEEAGYLTDASFSPDGTRIVAVHRRSSFDNDIIEIDIAGGTGRYLSPRDGHTRFRCVEYSAQDGVLYTVTDSGSDFLYIASLDIVHQTLSPLIEVPWDVEGITLSRKKGLLAFGVNENGTSRLSVMDVERGEVTKVPVGDGVPGVLGGVDISTDEKSICYSFSSAVRTSDIYLFEFGGTAARPITRSSHGGIDPGRFVAPRAVSFPSFDLTDDGTARRIPAWYYSNGSDTGKAPVIVTVHGGPEGQSRPSFSGITQFFVHSGFRVLVPNVRGSTGYGKEYSHLDDVEHRMDSVEDLDYSAQWLCGQPDVDDRRLVVFGGSYGGFMVLSSITTHPERWAAAVDIVGISNFVTFLTNTSDYRRAHREAEYGSLESDREFLQSISPMNSVGQITCPVIILHGANDPRVPLGEAEQLESALRERDIPVELLVFDDEGHGITKLKNKLTAYPAIVDFLIRHLEISG